MDVCSIKLDFFFRITQNNWIDINYTDLEQAKNNFLWALLVHVNFLNNTCNFILYVLVSPTFRKQMIATFSFLGKPKFVRQWGNSVAPTSVVDTDSTNAG